MAKPKQKAPNTNTILNVADPQPATQLFYVTKGYVVIDDETRLSRSFTSRDECLAFIGKHTEMKNLRMMYNNCIACIPVQ